MEVTGFLASVVVGVLIVGGVVRLVRRAKEEKKQNEPPPLLGVVYPRTTDVDEELEDKKRAKRALHDRDTES